MFLSTRFVVLLRSYRTAAKFQALIPPSFGEDDLLFVGIFALAQHADDPKGGVARAVCKTLPLECVLIEAISQPQLQILTASHAKMTGRFSAKCCQTNTFWGSFIRVGKTQYANKEVKPTVVGAWWFRRNFLVISPGA